MLKWQSFPVEIGRKTREKERKGVLNYEQKNDYREHYD